MGLEMKQRSLIATSRVTVTSTSTTLANLLKAAGLPAVPDNIKQLTIIPQGTMSCMLNAPASSSTPTVPSGGQTHDIGAAANAKNLQFYASTNTSLDVYMYA